jgi:hypothetical protein
MQEKAFFWQTITCVRRLREYGNKVTEQLHIPSSFSPSVPNRSLLPSSCRHFHICLSLYWTLLTDCFWSKTSSQLKVAILCRALRPFGRCPTRFKFHVYTVQPNPHQMPGHHPENTRWNAVTARLPLGSLSNNRPHHSSSLGSSALNWALVASWINRIYCFTQIKT